MHDTPGVVPNDLNFKVGSSSWANQYTFVIAAITASPSFEESVTNISSAVGVW